MSLTLITGVQAAGKSTVAQALAERMPRSVHVRGDAFRRMIVNGRADMDPVDSSPEAIRQLQVRYALATSVADGYADAGFDVVLQDIILGPDLERVIARIRTRPLFVVVLAPDPATVEERDRERRRRRGKIAYRAGARGIAALDAVLRVETPRVGLWLDTSELTVDETVSTILERLDSDARISP